MWHAEFKFVTAETLFNAVLVVLLHVSLSLYCTRLSSSPSNQRIYKTFVQQ